jgi:carbohydrate-selective porin OprB
MPLRDRKVATQLTYDLLMPDRLFIRPLLQWVSHPNARASGDRAKDRRLRDTVAAGVRLRLAL